MATAVVENTATAGAQPVAPTMKIVKGVASTKPKVMIYGLSGVGKSTLASRFKRPLFLDVEDGLGYLDVDKVPIKKLSDLWLAIMTLAKNDEYRKTYDTIVIDSLDWLVALLIANIQGIDDAKTKEDLASAMKMTLSRANGGYGGGKQELETRVRNELLKRLQLLSAVGYQIVGVAHAQTREVTDEDGVTREKLTPKIQVDTMNIFVEWFDHVVFLKKDATGERSLVVFGTPDTLAKNRIGLADEILVTDDLDINALLMPKAKTKVKASEG